MSLDVRFWGVRGSFPAPGADYAGYGGDTSCVAVTHGARTYVFDAGSGLARFGEAFSGVAEIDIFLSHLHLDHVMGLAYFAPIWREGSTVRIWLEASAAAAQREAILRLFSPPFHPIVLSEAPAQIEWRTYACDGAFSPGPGALVTPARLPHPGGAIGFRLSCGGASIVYGADTGALSGAARADALAWARGADVLILDATFSCAEAEARPDWGHMSWREAVAFGVDAQARQIALFHHGPERRDRELDAIAAEAHKLSDKVIIARDGMGLAVMAGRVVRAPI